ncbi:MAG: ABC transporter permease [Proteobacteria bacterium]|nr:ABC transporter permease [Pseudomonadota bacterium]
MTAQASQGRLGGNGMLTVRARVIWALLMREMQTRFGRNNVGFLWIVIEPLLLASAIAALHAGDTKHGNGDIRPVPFMIVGYTVFYLFRAIVNRAESAMHGNTPLLYHRQVMILDVLIARAIIEIAGVLGSATLLMSIAVLLDAASPPARPLFLILAYFVMLAYVFTLSLLLMAACHFSTVFAKLIHPLTYLSLPITGGFFMMRWIPVKYRDILEWLPTTHIYELARYGQFQNANLDYVDPLFILVCCLVQGVFGLIALDRVRQHLNLH